MSEQRWMPTSERLPEVGVTVLGWDRDGHHTLHQYCGKLKSGGDMWLGCHLAGGEYEDGMIGYEPEYWMPLPEPPREKDFDPEYASMELTDEEREAIEKACSSLERDDRFYENEAASLRATLERLLERTK